MSHQIALENRLLHALAESDGRQLEVSLVHLAQDQSVYVQGDSFEHLYFPLDCVVSSVAVMGDGATVEVFLTGREGVTGVVSMFGGERARNWTRVLIAGVAVRARAEAVKRLFKESEGARRVLLGHYSALITQISQRAVCNGRHTILQRLACWLLMLHDRVGADEIRLTQEEMAGKLGVRRAGVTQAARLLLTAEAVDYNHGRVNVLDRHVLEYVACECYKVHREEFVPADEKVAGQPRAAAPALGPAPAAGREKLMHLVSEGVLPASMIKHERGARDF